MAELTVKEYAALERVTENTVRRWIAKGAVTVNRTPSGRLRIPRAATRFAVLSLQSSANTARQSTSR